MYVAVILVHKWKPTMLHKSIQMKYKHERTNHDTADDYNEKNISRLCPYVR